MADSLMTTRWGDKNAPESDDVCGCTAFTTDVRAQKTGVPDQSAIV
jgi:hypothetical protein